MGSLETPFVAVILLIIVSSLGFLLSKNKGSQPIKTLISLLLPLLTSYSSVLVFFFFFPLAIFGYSGCIFGVILGKSIKSKNNYYVFHEQL